ncbi:hypothetical protein ASF32_23985 [Methylobacterium sp. Leaf91]|nr:hypothetical protein ASF32_23985 [Methylobacterium sp. Leaf91]
MIKLFRLDLAMISFVGMATLVKKLVQMADQQTSMVSSNSVALRTGNLTLMLSTLRFSPRILSSHYVVMGASKFIITVHPMAPR